MKFKNWFRHYAQYTPDLKSLLNLNYVEFKEVHSQHWHIEQFHRAVKQVCNI